MEDSIFETLGRARGPPSPPISVESETEIEEDEPNLFPFPKYRPCPLACFMIAKRQQLEKLRQRFGYPPPPRSLVFSRNQLRPPVTKRFVKAAFLRLPARAYRALVVGLISPVNSHCLSWLRGPLHPAGRWGRKFVFGLAICPRFGPQPRPPLRGDRTYFHIHPRRENKTLQ
jgi:hypothetical protein